MAKFGNFPVAFPVSPWQCWNQSKLEGQWCRWFWLMCLFPPWIKGAKIIATSFIIFSKLLHKSSRNSRNMQKYLTWLSLLLLKQLTRSRAWPPTFSRCKSPADRIWPHDCKLGHMMSHDCWLRCVKTFFEGNRHLPLPQSKQNCAKSTFCIIFWCILPYLGGFFLLSVAAYWHISTPTRPRAEIPLRVSAPNPSGVACDSQVTLLAVCHCAIEVEKGNEGDKECEHSTYSTCVNMSMITMIVNGITVYPFTFHLPVNHCEPLWIIAGTSLE